MSQLKAIHRLTKEYQFHQASHSSSRLTLIPARIEKNQSMSCTLPESNQAHSRIHPSANRTSGNLESHHPHSHSPHLILKLPIRLFNFPAPLSLLLIPPSQSTYRCPSGTALLSLSASLFTDFLPAASALLARWGSSGLVAVVGLGRISMFRLPSEMPRRWEALCCARAFSSE